MKKLFILSILIMFLAGSAGINTAFAAEDAKVIKDAIAKYKERNFIGCISDLRRYTQKDPTSAMAWYYLGSAYMNISLKDAAYDAFNKVIELDSVPKLTSYAIQAQLCMEDKSKCEYQNFTKDEIEKLKENPAEFLSQYFTVEEPEQKNQNVEDIEKLIENKSTNKVHKNAQQFIDEEILKIKSSQMNSK